MIDISGEIEQLAQQYLGRIRRSGPENIMALCPFHEDSKPSFAMSLINGTFFCHAGCGGGSLRTFLRRVGISAAEITYRYDVLLREAKKHVPKPPDPEKPGVFSMKPIDEAFLGLFDMCPTLLLEQGFLEETLLNFEVGYDRWHKRITFPLRDVEGQLVGLSGRNLTDEWPKYKVYDKEYPMWGLPERVNWDKRMVLYNAHATYPTLQQFDQPTARYLAIVEGFKAAMWLYQAGIRNVNALLGSYLSWEQKWILEHLKAPVYLFLDNNEAGIKGTFTAGEALIHSGVGVYVIEYPERLASNSKAQPDDLHAEEVLHQFHHARQYSRWLDSFMDPPIGQSA